MPYMKNTGKIKDGYPVYDLTGGEMIVNVEPVDVHYARRNDALCCVMHNALVRMPGVIQVIMRGTMGWLLLEDPKDRVRKWIRFEHPKSLKKAIIDFDNSGLFVPGEYRLKPVAPSHRLGVLANDAEKSKAFRARQKDIASGSPSLHSTPRPRIRHVSLARSGYVG